MATKTPGQETHLNPHDAHKNKPTKAEQKAKTEKALKPLAEAKNGDILKPADINARKKYVERIQAAMGKSVLGFIEAGRQLTEAKERLAHGQFEEMVNDDLNMSRSTAARLMEIYRHPVISDVANSLHLPPTWTTLYDLTRVPQPRLEAKLKDGTINPQMTGKEVKELLPKSKSTKKQKPVDDDPEEETTAGSMSAEDQWEQAVANAASEIISLDAFYTRTFGEEWKDFRASSNVVTLVKQATAAWNKLAAHIGEEN